MLGYPGFVSVTLATYGRGSNAASKQGRKGSDLAVAARSSTKLPSSAPADAPLPLQITDQSALFASPADDFRVDMLVAAGDRVAQGAPVLRSRRHPELTLVAPVAGDVAALDLGPGRRLSQVLFFHVAEAGRHQHDVAAARQGSDPAATRAALLAGGLWPFFRSRPFGRMPLPGERAAAIFVMAADTRPDAPAVRLALHGREEDFSRGLRALAGLTDGPVIVCHDGGIGDVGVAGDRVKPAKVASTHPHGLAGFQIAARFPAAIGRTVWDIHAEDVAGLGAFLATGLLPQTRLVSVSGTALREQRLLRCQPGADLRALTFDIVRPGPHRLLSGSSLDGVEGRWLGQWRRQVTAIAGGPPQGLTHWFSAALRRSGRPLPVIPTAALDQAFGGILPAALLVRALAANDAESAVRLGALSLLEEDVALADYLTAASPRIAAMLRAMLDRIRAEEQA